MTRQLSDGGTVEDISTYLLDELSEADFREILTYLLRDFLDIRIIHIARDEPHGRIRSISFTRGD